MNALPIVEKLRFLANAFGGDGHAELTEAADTIEQLYGALERAVKKLRVATLAGGTDAEFADAMLEPLSAALAKARGDQ